MARVVHLANPVSAGLRDAVLRATPPSVATRRLAPVVDYDAASAV
jgi:hypothetical protein